MRILEYPDPILQRVGEPIRVIDDEVRQRVHEMFETMYGASGVGLAAPQVGWSAQLFVMNRTAGDDADQDRVFVNPRILKRSGRIVAEEGCLSFPGVTVHVPRARWILAEATDLDGRTFQVEATDLAARIIQHEYDHLQGILFIDKMTPADRIAVDKKIKEMRSALQARDG